jgi:rare lipoprotein A
MQTKRQMSVLLIAVSLLWTSLASAATPKILAHNATKNAKLSYVGTASWYGKKHQGLKMANGKRFDRHKLTAASWYFPLGTEIRVVNIKNGESVVVKITDRGPNLRLHRLIDLSEAAAGRLDYIGQGLTPVFIYPVVSFKTESAPLRSNLVEPRSVTTSVTYQAKVLNDRM